MRYQGRNTQAISFPLGGIGTGSIGLAGNGMLIDWEIRNRPNKCSHNGFSFLAIKAERGRGSARRTCAARRFGHALSGHAAPREVFWLWLWAGALHVGRRAALFPVRV